MLPMVAATITPLNRGGVIVPPDAVLSAIALPPVFLGHYSVPHDSLPCEERGQDAARVLPLAKALQRSRDARSINRVAGDLCAPHDTAERTGVVDRQMFCAAVVPERDRSVVPTKAAGELGPGGVSQQILQQ